MAKTDLEPVNRFRQIVFSLEEIVNSELANTSEYRATMEAKKRRILIDAAESIRKRGDTVITPIVDLEYTRNIGMENIK